MRWAVAVVAVAVALAGAESAQALSCIGPPPVLMQYQDADAVVTASLVNAQPIGPEEPPPAPGPPYIAGWDPPTGPVVLARYRIVRVFKADAEGPRVGDVFSRWGRVWKGSWLPPWPRTAAFLLNRTDGGLDGSFSLGICSSGPPSRGEIRRAALLHRFGDANGAESSACDRTGKSCWSIKRDGREAILRFATYESDGNFTPLRLWDFERQYDLCVRAPDGTRTCRRGEMNLDATGLLSSRVRWSRLFPDRGRGLYRVRWLPPDFERYGYAIRKYHRVLPRLEFRR